MLGADLTSSEAHERLHPTVVSDGDRCQGCFTEGRKSRVRNFQINSEEYVSVCSSEKCISNTSSSTLILKRKASEIPNLRKRRRRPCLAARERLSDWPRSDVSLIWRNKQSLCWLDSSLLLLVFCQSLRKCLCIANDELSLKKLCKKFDDAQMQLEMINRTAIVRGELNSSDRGFSDLAPLGNDYKGLEKTRTNNDEMFSNFGDSLELLRVLEEIPRNSVLEEDTSRLTSKNTLLSKNISDGNTVDPLDGVVGSEGLSELSSSLDEVREKIWEQVQPQLRCRKGDEDSPVFALPVLLGKNQHLEAHFKSSFRWQFYCSRCHYVDISQEKRVVLSLKTLNKSLSPTSYFSHRQCPCCQSPQERNSLVIQKLPACPMFHFVEGLPQLKSWDQLEFHHGNYDYKVATIIQYKQNPRHFVTWIKDCQRNLWLEGDDLKKPVVQWCEEEPKFPSSQAHMVMWERQGRCSECTEEQARVQSIALADESDLKQLLQRRESCLFDEGENVKFVNYLKAYIPKRTKDLSHAGENALNAKRTDTEPHRTESSSRARRKSTEPFEKRSAAEKLGARGGNKIQNRRRKTLIGNSLASKFAAFSESLPTFVEFKDMMEERKRKNSKCLLRTIRSGSVSPLCSPSGSSESCSLPDNSQNVLPDLDLILEDFTQTEDRLPVMSTTELELFLQNF